MLSFDDLAPRFLAHGDQPVGPHDLWSVAVEPGPLDAAIAIALVATLVAQRRGRPAGEVWWRGRHLAFHAGLLVVAVALLSPLDAMADSLASAHMVQHLLLGVVASPLLAGARPGPILLRGAPTAVRLVNRGIQRRVRTPTRYRLRELMPVVAWLSAAGALWFWHSATAYEAALADDGLHWLQHATFLATGVLFWSVIISSGGPRRPGPGASVLLLFLMMMQGALLSTLLVFAPEPWYPTYGDTTAVWGLDPLTDQRLAGVLMWLVAGVVHTAAALSLLVRWLLRSDATEVGGSPGAPVPFSQQEVGHGIRLG